MQKLFLPFLLLFAVTVFAQPGEKEQRQVKTKLVIDSSASVKLKQFSDSLEKAQTETFKTQMNENLQRGNDYFLQLQKERRAKEKKAAMIRIGIGIFFLLILVIGLRRRIKK
jgi:hypothetical protein